MSGDKVVYINFSELGGPTYIGRPNGEAARKKINLDSIENQKDVVFIVNIPASTYNINSSYFLGLFGSSIRKAGSEEAFFKRFTFDTMGKEYRSISRGVQRALMKNKGLNIG